MRLILVFLSCLALQGCWFFMLPASSSDQVSAANTCVPADYYVGQKLRNENTGQTGKIAQLHGRHQRCQIGSHPILATVEYE